MDDYLDSLTTMEALRQEAKFWRDAAHARGEVIRTVEEENAELREALERFEVVRK